MAVPLTLEALKRVLRYDPETGLFTHLRAMGRYSKAGDVAGHLSKKDGVLRVWCCGKLYVAARLAWFYMTGEWPVALIDHRDQNPANNVWVNLREATKVQNGQNRGAPKTNTSGIKGVSFHRPRGKWVAQIRAAGKNRYLGLFLTKEEAGLARARAELQYFGEFSPLSEA